VDNLNDIFPLVNTAVGGQLVNILLRNLPLPWTSSLYSMHILSCTRCHTV